MSASMGVAIGLALVTVIAWARLARRGTGLGGGRLAILLAAQPLLAVLLYLTLFPPPGIAAAGGTLVVATRGAPRVAALAGSPRIDLPEAGHGLGGEPAPDLATALRRHPGVARLRILGEGLEPRDREAAAGLALAFEPAPPPRGLSGLYPPERVAPGGAFQVGGEAEGEAGGSVELLDPAGRVVDAQPLSPTGGFTLTATARDPGPALFALRVRDRGRAVREVADAPVWVAADPGPRVLLLAGAPGPEVKQLRRWALDAGVALQASVGAGDGLELGEARPRLDAATLGRLDLVVVDERSLAGLALGERAALAAATRAGLGLLLRVTGPVPAGVRDQWAALGPPLASGDATAVVRLAPHAVDGLPDLTRRLVDVPTADSAPLTPDAASAVLGRWRAVGRGRAGVWAVTDSSGLVTAGFGERYGELWSAIVATLARPSLPPATISGDTSFAGRRVSLCGIDDGAQVLGPDGGAARLDVDPAAGSARCAGYWPLGAGWRRLRVAQRQDRPFYVYPADALPALQARERREATIGLERTDASLKRAEVPTPSPGPAWPWLLLLLIACAGVWRFERALGRRQD